MFCSREFLLLPILLVTFILGSTNSEESCSDVLIKLNEAVNRLDELQRSVNGFRSDTTAEWKSLHNKFLEMESKVSNIKTNSLQAVTASKKCRERSLCQIPGLIAVTPEGSINPPKLLCGGDHWLIVMQRFDGSVKFNDKSWLAYKSGFGNVSGASEFFLGLLPLHEITKDTTYELRFELTDFNEHQRIERYSEFSVGNEASGFKLGPLGYYTGDAGDSFKYHEGQAFSTLDRDNDAKYIGSCSEEYNSAGWFKSCMEANIFGGYLHGRHDHVKEGMYWETFGGSDYSLKSITMSIRERC